MFKSLSLALIALSLALPAVAAPFPRARLPIDAAAVKDFVPAGWQVENQVSGDLNKDGLADLAVTLIETKPSGDVDSRERALLLLFKRRDGKLHRAAVAEKLLQCTSCGGAFYGAGNAPAHVKIVKGVLIVEQDYGSRNVVEDLYRFWFDAKLGKFVLIGYDSSDRDRNTGELVLTSTNYLTGKQIVTKLQYDDKSDSDVKKSTSTKTVAKSAQPIESISYEAR